MCDSGTVSVDKFGPARAVDAAGNGERTAATAVVRAPAERVMSVLRDVAAYPEWAEPVRSATVLTTGPSGLPETVRFELDAGPVVDTYVLRYSWSADGRSVSWVLETSLLQQAQSGSYRLTPVVEGTAVAYELRVQLAVPTIGRVRSRAERRIVGAALSELRRRSEREPAPDEPRHYQRQDQERHDQERQR